VCLGYTTGASILEASLVRENIPEALVKTEQYVATRDIPVNCMWCEFAVDMFKKKFLPNVKSEAQLINETTFLCMEILKNKTECALLGPLVGHLLWTEKSSTSQKICQTLKACPSSFTLSASHSNVIQHIGNGLSKHITQENDIPVNCMWCQLAVQFLEKNLLNKVTSEDMLEKTITSLCEQVLPNNKTLCEMVGPLVAPYIWDAKTQSPKKTCAMINVCPATISGNQGLEISNGTMCSLCKGLVDVVKTAVLGNICTSAIKADLPADIEKYLDPKMLCTLAKVCG